MPARAEGGREGKGAPAARLLKAPRVPRNGGKGGQLLPTRRRAAAQGLFLGVCPAFAPPRLLCLRMGPQMRGGGSAESRGGGANWGEWGPANQAIERRAGAAARSRATPAAGSTQQQPHVAIGSSNRERGSQRGVLRSGGAGRAAHQSLRHARQAVLRNAGREGGGIGEGAHTRHAQLHTRLCFATREEGGFVFGLVVGVGGKGGRQA